MSIDLNELIDAAQKAFPADALAPSRDENWALAAEMGWLMIRVSEDDGGLGLGREASTAIHYEMGRVLSTLPLIPAQLGQQAIAASTIDGREDWLERIMGGEYIPLHMLGAKVAQDGDAYSGTISGVFEADIASHIVAALPDRYALVPLEADGVSVSERETWDETRRIFDVELSGFVPELVLASGKAARDLHDALSVETHLAVAADCLGGAIAALDMSVEYLKTRKQFDRPLAMFQALKHRCADLKKEIELGDSLLWQGAAADRLSRIDGGSLKAFAAQVYRDVAEDAIQLHGGIGLTVELPVHLFMKRAMLSCVLAGDGDFWSEQRGRAMLETEAD